MTRAELKPLYVQAAARARCKPQPTEEGVWFKELERFDARDLDAAISSWFDGGNVWMPKESELKPRAEQAKQARLRAIQSAKVLVCWRCTICKRTASDYITPDDHRQRYCRAPKPEGRGDCGGNMEEFLRESAA